MSTKEALQKLWTDTCTVYEYKPIQKENHTTVHQEAAVLVNEPCKLSFSKLAQASQTETAASLVQVIKLFLSDSIAIKAGSKIVVKRRDKEFTYGYSGESGIFSNHQEIVLTKWEGWAK